MPDSDAERQTVSPKCLSAACKVGGYNKFYGPIIGVIVLTMFDESIRGFDEIRPAIYGAVLILSILFLPLGLESIPGKLKAWFIGSEVVEPPLTDE